MRKWLISAFLLVTLLGLSACGQSQPRATTQPVKLRIGVQPVQSPLWIMKERRALEKYGYQVEWVEVNHAAALMEAFAAGSVDLGEAGVPPLLAARSKGAKIVGIADSVGGVAYGVVRVGAGVNKPSDLKGKKIAYPGKGTWQYGLVRVILDRGGLKESDVQLVRVPFPDMVALMSKGEVDAAFSVDPFVGLMLYDQKAKVLIGPQELKGSKEGHTFSGQLAATEVIVSKYPQAIENVRKELAEVNKWILANPDEAAKVFDKVFGGKVPLASIQYSLRNRLTYYYQDVVLDEVRLREFIATTNELGMTDIKDADAFLKGYTFRAPAK